MWGEECQEFKRRDADPDRTINDATGIERSAWRVSNDRRVSLLLLLINPLLLLLLLLPMIDQLLLLLPLLLFGIIVNCSAAAAISVDELLILPLLLLLLLLLLHSASTDWTPQFHCWFSCYFAANWSTDPVAVAIDLELWKIIDHVDSRLVWFASAKRKE